MGDKFLGKILWSFRLRNTYEVYWDFGLGRIKKGVWSKNRGIRSPFGIHIGGRQEGT